MNESPKDDKTKPNREDTIRFLGRVVNGLPIRRAKSKKSILRDSAPNFWACECGQMNLRGDPHCCICGGDREDCWEEIDREEALRKSQWHAN
jgi:hypothetical protein